MQMIFLVFCMVFKKREKEFGGWRCEGGLENRQFF